MTRARPPLSRARPSGQQSLPTRWRSAQDAKDGGRQEARRSRCNCEPCAPRLPMLARGLCPAPRLCLCVTPVSAQPAAPPASRLVAPVFARESYSRSIQHAARPLSASLAARRIN